jgi:hypothetical protein
MKKMSRDCANVKTTINKLSETVNEYVFGNVKLYTIHGKEHVKSKDWAFTWDFNSNNEQLKHNMVEYKNDREKYLNDKKKNHLLRT